MRSSDTYGSAKEVSEASSSVTPEKRGRVLQFFLYFVFWPFFLGAGFTFLSFTSPAFAPYFLALWIGLYFWPLGRLRKHYLARHLAELVGLPLDSSIEEIDQTTESLVGSGKVEPWAVLAVALGPYLLMALSAIAGVATTPIFMEVGLGVSVESSLEEIQKRGQSH